MYSVSGRWLVAVFFCVFLGGCAAPRVLDTAEQAVLEERAQQRWVALINRDWARAYDFTSPAYRAVFTREMYERKFSYLVEWQLTSVEFLHYDADAAVASVAVRVMSRPAKLTSAASEAIGAVPTRFVEQWILSDDQWWYSANL